MLIFGASTITEHFLVFSPITAVIIAFPAFFPFTIPFLETVATDFLLVFHRIDCVAYLIFNFFVLPFNKVNDVSLISIGLTTLGFVVTLCVVLLTEYELLGVPFGKHLLHAVNPMSLASDKLDGKYVPFPHLCV